MSYEDIPGRYAMRWIVDDAIARTPQGGVWVEVGVALGKGIAYMGEALARAGRDDVRLYAVDPWGGYARNGEQQANAPADAHGDWSLFLDTMQAHAPDVLRRIHILRAPSSIAALTFAMREISLCIIDANHSYAEVCRDLHSWLPRMRAGGIIAGDDHEPDFPGVEQACREFFGSYETRRAEEEWCTWRKVVP